MGRNGSGKSNFFLGMLHFLFIGFNLSVVFLQRFLWKYRISIYFHLIKVIVDNLLIWCDCFLLFVLLTPCFCIIPFFILAIQFVLSDEFSHMGQEERQQLLHVNV